MMRYCKLFLIGLIFLLLVIPLFHMNTAEITEQENRTLAKFPELKKKDKLNTDFGKEFESWLGDRFWGRDELIDARFQTLYKINGRIENEKAFIGDDGWMFEKLRTINIPSIEKQREKIKRDVEILKKFSNKFKGKDISIYLVLVPDREYLYQKHWEWYYRPKSRLDYGDELTKLLSDHPNIKIIYPKGEFMMGSENYFYKDDYHLNGKGTLLLGRSVLKFFKIDDSVYTVKKMEKNKKDFYIAKALGIKNVVYEDDAKALFATHSNAKYNVLKVLSKELDPLNLYEVGESTHPIKNEKLYLLGVCYSRDALFPFLKYAYQNTERITVWSLPEGKEDLYQFRLKRIKEIYKNKEKFSIIIMLTNFPKQELKIIEDSLSD